MQDAFLYLVHPIAFFEFNGYPCVNFSFDYTEKAMGSRDKDYRNTSRDSDRDERNSNSKRGYDSYKRDRDDDERDSKRYSANKYETDKRYRDDAKDSKRYKDDDRDSKRHQDNYNKDKNKKPER